MPGIIGVLTVLVVVGIAGLVLGSSTTGWGPLPGFFNWVGSNALLIGVPGLIVVFAIGTAARRATY